MLLVFNIPVFDGDDLFLGFKRPDQRTDFIGSDIAGYQASDPSSHGQHKFKLLSLARQSAPLRTCIQWESRRNGRLNLSLNDGFVHWNPRVGTIHEDPLTIFTDGTATQRCWEPRNTHLHSAE